MSLERRDAVRVGDARDDPVVEDDVERSGTQGRDPITEQGLGEGRPEGRQQQRPHREQEQSLQARPSTMTPHRLAEQVERVDRGEDLGRMISARRWMMRRHAPAEDDDKGKEEASNNGGARLPMASKPRFNSNVSFMLCFNSQGSRAHQLTAGRFT